MIRLINNSINFFKNKFFTLPNRSCIDFSRNTSQEKGKFQQNKVFFYNENVGSLWIVCSVVILFNFWISFQSFRFYLLALFIFFVVEMEIDFDCLQRASPFRRCSKEAPKIAESKLGDSNKPFLPDNENELKIYKNEMRVIQRAFVTPRLLFLFVLNISRVSRFLWLAIVLWKNYVWMF